MNMRMRPLCIHQMPRVLSPEIGNSTITNLGTLTVAAETTPDVHAQASSNEQYR